jgi:hypothetical protein
LFWLAVSVSSISEPVFFKVGFAVNKEVYKCLPVLHIFKKIEFWPDLASAHYANDTLFRLKELKIDTAEQIFFGDLEKEGLQQQLWSKICKMLDGKDQKRAEVH